MKQHITKSQWGELDKEGQKKLTESFETGWKHVAVTGVFLPNIGQMIEFLGDDYMADDLIIDQGMDCYASGLKLKGLCDNLWKLVKYKLGK